MHAFRNTAPSRSSAARAAHRELALDLTGAENLVAGTSKNGVKVGYSIPKEGAPMWFDMVAMPADAPDEKAGYAYMNYLLQPEVMANISNHVQYANGNIKADGLVDPAMKGNTMIYPSEDVMGKLYALEAMPAKIDRIRTRIWTSIKAGN